METAAVTDGGATPLMEEMAPPIYITGDQVSVSRVKDMLSKLAVQKVAAWVVVDYAMARSPSFTFVFQQAKSMYHKDAILHGRKLDWMLLHRRDELRKIMHDNGMFIDNRVQGVTHTHTHVYTDTRALYIYTKLWLDLSVLCVYRLLHRFPAFGLCGRRRLGYCLRGEPSKCGKDVAVSQFLGK